MPAILTAVLHLTVACEWNLSPFPIRFPRSFAIQTFRRVPNTVRIEICVYNENTFSTGHLI